MAKHDHMPSSKKAKMMMKEGSIKGHPMTEKQKGLFGLIAGGGKPSKMSKMAKKLRKK